MINRIFDIFFSSLALLIIAPVFLFIAFLIILESKGGVFYKQIRVGKGQRLFNLYKFRSMKPGSDRKGLLTVGGRDARITRMGVFLRSYKLDELPQLFNILRGDMSFVGPRPEVPKYVNLYNQEQKKVLSVKPGLTDYASLEYFDESNLLAGAEDPEKYYIEKIMPDKLALNIRYIADKSFITDIKIIFKTLLKILLRK